MSALVLLKGNFFFGRLWCLGHSELGQKRGKFSTESHASTLPEEKGESLIIIIIQVFFASTNIYVWHLQAWELDSGSIRPSLGPWKVPFLEGEISIYLNSHMV